jgi:hypothetical protein
MPCIIVEIRRELFIKPISKHYNVSRETVKPVQNAMRGRLQACVLLNDVSHIGTDEIYLLKEHLRGICTNFGAEIDAMDMLEEWMRNAEQTEIHGPY